MFLLTNWEDAAVRKYSERRPSSKWIVIRPTSPLTNVYSYSRTPPLDITNLYLTQGWIRGYSVTAYPRIHLVNIFKIIVAGYPRIRVSTSIYKAYKAYRISMCLKATEGRKAHKRERIHVSSSFRDTASKWQGILQLLQTIFFTPVIVKYSRLPITRTFKGNRNRKQVRVIGSSKKIAGSKVKNSFYCTVNILITFYSRNVKWKLKDTFRLKIRTLLNKTLPK